ncbi:MAG TPA: YegP family protein [Fimbriimonas sp.]|nr:YegP family protein [Fimbriimonas sp.]
MGKYSLKKAKDDSYFFHLKAGNGQTILSSEMYTTKAAAENGIESVRTNSAIAERFEKKESKGGDPYFVLKAGNHQVIGTSEMYSSDAACQNGIESVMENGPDSPTDDETD